MNKIALVTGANRGLGRNTALWIARRCRDIIVAYRSDVAQAAEVVGEIEALGFKAVALRLDVSKVSELPDFAATLQHGLRDIWGRDSFDHLVNNAGHGEFTPFAQTTAAQFDGLFNVHVKGVYFLTQALPPLIADNGRIVNFSTGLTRFSAEGFSAYAAAKGAVEVLIRYLAKELWPRCIAVNSVAQGAL